MAMGSALLTPQKGQVMSSSMLGGSVAGGELRDGP